MTDQDMLARKQIETALKSFSSENISKSALSLFDALGYNTNRQNPFLKKTSAAFEESFGHVFAERKFNKDKARFTDWKRVDLLFQLSREELSGQQGLFDTRKVRWEGEDKETVIETYLFFAIELSGAEYSRTALAQITREVNKVFPMPVMIVFKHGRSLTFSIINRRLHKKNDQKDVLEKVTLIKDISIESPHRAHIEILYDLSLTELKCVHKFTNFVELHQAWQKTLDTKELNKRFYLELSNWYFWAMDHVSFPDDVEKNEALRNATSLIRLITRIIFIWFIKEKDLVPEVLFDRRELSRILKAFDKNKKSDSYYRAVLQNLFFGTLNQRMNERGFAREGSFLENRSNYGVKNLFRYAGDFAIDEKEALSLFKDIPFLNGGLFDCLDKENDEDKVIYSDGFSRNPKKQAVVPDFLFFGEENDYDLNAIYGTRNKRYKVKGLFNILSAYKFTVAENTPVEEEIALDPELLGRVFENLLASYNPETQTTARKQTGSFYTPREIVNYMVDESLKAYLKQKLEAEMKPEDADAGLEILFSYTEKEHAFTGRETKALIAAIDDCKILDPACGSGAFPMGVLHKFVHILHKLDPHNEKWQERQIAKARQIDDPTIREQSIANIEAAFTNNELDYGRKLYLIENCIYGVDIQPIAVQIAKLRFFISLVVDQKKQPAKKNLGILSLPNLETKFVAANTLIGLDKPQLGGQISIKNPEIDKLEDDLKALRHQYFNARTRKEKLTCQKKDKDLRKKIATLLEKDGWNRDAAHSVAAFDPYDQNASSPFFDPEWMFGITDGFDVVTGNPPYLESRHPSFDEQLKDLYQLSCQIRWGNDAKYITRGADLLVYFFEMSLHLINDSGNIILITQNAWLDTEYGIKIQAFLRKHTNVVSIIDSKFRYFPVGEGPNINTVITQFFRKKPDSTHKIGFYMLKNNIEDISLEKSSYVNQENENYKVNYFSYSDDLLKKYKWGILQNADSFIIDLIKILEKKAKTIDKIPSTTIFSFGQGLNLNKSAFIPLHILEKFKISQENCFPIHYTGAPYQLRDTDWFLVRKNLVNKSTIKNLHEDGYIAFDETSTRKIPPVLIMPRGVSKHFCSLNTVAAYSLSGVDVYANDSRNIDKEVLNLWCFFNSSVFWLLREISGRKNLGGGMLKSEATDLNVFPVYLSLEINKSYFKDMFNREAMETLIEISSDDHKLIDRIVFDYLGFNQQYRELCVEYLCNAVTFRCNRSVT